MTGLWLYAIEPGPITGLAALSGFLLGSVLLYWGRYGRGEGIEEEPEIRHAPYCTECSVEDAADHRLEETDENFKDRHPRYYRPSVYKCPNCDATFEVRKLYKIIPKEIQSDRRTRGGCSD